MKSLNDYLVVVNVKEKQKETKGLYIPENVTKDVRYIKAKIVLSNDDFPDISKDALIYYDKNAGHNLTIDNKLHKVIRVRDIVVLL